MSATVMICFRGTPELRVQLEEYCGANNLNISELMRVLVNVVLGGQEEGIAEGYQQARRLSILLAHQALRAALSHLPDTYDEALTRLPIEPNQ